ncbi:Protein doublesex [Aphelenchoides fujianensis]|nr:Protein doublesex [Aphelenchoides fujianensis]
MFSPPRVYFCQRCANHGRAVRRRGHRAACPFVACGCADCRLVGRRRELNARLNELNGRTVDVEVVAEERAAGGLHFAVQSRSPSKRCA